MLELIAEDQDMKLKGREGRKTIILLSQFCIIVIIISIIVKSIIIIIILSKERMLLWDRMVWGPRQELIERF